MKSLNNKNNQMSGSQLSTGVPQKRTAFRMVASTFEPPSQPQHQAFLKPSASQQTKFTENDFQSQTSLFNYSSSNFNSNVQFIGSLALKVGGLNEKVDFDEGDCIPISSDDRWLVLAGEVKVQGINGCSFVKGVGFIFFASAETKRKVKQVIAVNNTTLLRLPQSPFKSHIRENLFLKNSQKIKYLQYCPFIPQCHPYIEDIALTMQLHQPMNSPSLSHSFSPATTDKHHDNIIYLANSQARELFFVKEGIVLLERTGKFANQVLRDFQTNYETTVSGDDAGLVVVRKGMVFGVDGILIKEVVKEVNLSDNPEQPNRPYQQNQSITLKQTRIYTAKSLNKAQVYKLDKSILQTYLKPATKSSLTLTISQSDSYTSPYQPDQLNFSNKQLDRICLQYTNLLMGSSSLTHQIHTKNIQLGVDVDHEVEGKKRRVREIKMHERKMKRLRDEADNKDTRDTRKDRLEDADVPVLVRSSPRKVQTNVIRKSKDVSLPSLNKKHIQNLILKKLEMKQSDKYMSYKRKVQTIIFGKDERGELEKLEKTDKEKDKLKDKDKEKNKDKDIKMMENTQFMKVRSYRSLLNSLS